MNKFINEYSKIVKIVEGGQFGKIQAVIFSCNFSGENTELLEKIFSELTFADGIFACRVKNQTETFYSKPYKHGFIVREYENGQILRYALTCVDKGNDTQLTLYGNDGEIRFYSENGKIITFKQIPDYVGDEYTENPNIDGVMDTDKGVVGKTVVAPCEIKNNKKTADRAVKG